MSNKRKIASVAFTGAAAAAVTMMGAAPTLAAGTLQTKNAAPTASLPWRTQLKPGTVAVEGDTTRGTVLTCMRGAASGTTPSTSPVSLPANFGTMTMATFSSCTGPFGLTFKEHLTRPVGLIVSAVTRSSHGAIIHASGKMNGPINYKISGTGLAVGCKATISGTSIPWKTTPTSFYYNSGHKVTLKVKSATTGCLGAVAPGDKVFFAFDYVAAS